MTDPNPYYADGCPNCLTRDNKPTNGTTTGSSLTAAYRCRCGHTWTSAWDLTPGRILPPAQTRIADTAA